MSLRFGTAGIPHSAEKKHGVPGGVKQVHELGLDHMEVEFVYGVRMTEQKAADVKHAAETYGITLTAHGPYYINLASLEKEKQEKSIERIFKTAYIGSLMGAHSITFHAAFYLKRDPKEVMNIVIQNLETLMQQLADQQINIDIRPETTGKPSQFGTLDEICELSKYFDNVYPCIDFSHLYARSIGNYNTTDEFKCVLDKIADTFGQKGIENMHIHLSGIQYGKKGEIKHLILEESEMNYKDLLKVLKQYNASGAVICESPILEKDTRILKDYYESI